MNCIGALSFYDSKRSIGFLSVFLQEVVLLTWHFDLKANVRKAVIVNRLLLRARSFFDQALRLVNYLLTLKNVPERMVHIDNRF